MKSFRNDLQPLIIGNKLFILNAAVSPYIAVGVGYGYIQTKQSFSEIKDAELKGQSAFEFDNHGLDTFKYSLSPQLDLHTFYGQVGLGVAVAVHGPLFIAIEAYSGSHATVSGQQKVRFDGGLSLMLGMQLPQKFKVALGGGINCQNFDASMMSATYTKESSASTFEAPLKLHKGEKVRPSGVLQLWMERDMGRHFSIRWEMQMLLGKSSTVSTWVTDVQGESNRTLGVADFNSRAMHFRTNVSFVKSL